VTSQTIITSHVIVTSQTIITSYVTRTPPRSGLGRVEVRSRVCLGPKTAVTDFWPNRPRSGTFDQKNHGQEPLTKKTAVTNLWPKIPQSQSFYQKDCGLTKKTVVTDVWPKDSGWPKRLRSENFVTTSNSGLDQRRRRRAYLLDVPETWGWLLNARVRDRALCCANDRLIILT